MIKFILRYLALLSLIILFWTPPSMAGTWSMRRCMLLPIVDEFEGALSFKVFEQVEAHLKDGNWCYYRNNSEVVNILMNYQHNMADHLDNPEILKLVSDKVKAGSLIRIQLKKLTPGIEVKLTVYGDNGSDVYFVESGKTSAASLEEVSELIKNWLEVYSKQIPYDGVVTSVLGDQFTVDIGKAYMAEMGKKVQILHIKSQKKHPLLQEVVEWDFEVIAQGKLFNSSENQSMGVVLTYYSNKKLNKGDFVRILNDGSGVGDNKENSFPEVEKNEFGKLGEMALQLAIISGEIENSVSGRGETVKGYEGYKYGIDAEAKVFATRNYLASAMIRQNFGSYGPASGHLSNNGPSVSTTGFGIRGGYRFLPMGFFYGPQVDFLAGYQRYGHKISHNAQDKFGDVSFSGIIMSTRGDVPIIQNFRFGVEFDYGLGTSYSEKRNIFGSAESASSMRVEIGGTYMYAPTMRIIGDIEYLSNEAKFNGSSYTISDTALKVGASLDF